MMINIGLWAVYMIHAYWYNPINSYDVNNWGDTLNKVLIQKISGQKVVHVKPNNNIIKYICIGSILQKADTHSIIWGAGFLSRDRKFSVKPFDICAVRGPLSRQIIVDQGFRCPEVYGDPALLYPRFYKPVVTKKYRIGIVPHYVDFKHPWVVKHSESNEIKVIDILSGVNKVVDEINECEIIISSSLHGVIAADAYDIPAMWVKFSDKVLGGGFKFLDYFKSVGRADTDPIIITDDITIDEIVKMFYKYEIKIDLPELYDACPFKK